MLGGRLCCDGAVIPQGSARFRGSKKGFQIKVPEVSEVPSVRVPSEGSGRFRGVVLLLHGLPGLVQRHYNAGIFFSK